MYVCMFLCTCCCVLISPVFCSPSSVLCPPSDPTCPGVGVRYAREGLAEPAIEEGGNRARRRTRKLEAPPRSPFSGSWSGINYCGRPIGGRRVSRIPSDSPTGSLIDTPLGGPDRSSRQLASGRYCRLERSSCSPSLSLSPSRCQITTLAPPRYETRAPRRMNNETKGKSLGFAVNVELGARPRHTAHNLIGLAEWSRIEVGKIIARRAS